MKIFKLALTCLIINLLCSCVQKTHLKTITFEVDMRTVKNTENVGVRGNFTNNPWKETIPLTDEDNDGIYQATFNQTTAANEIEFKFVNQNLDFELKGGNNRSIQFDYKPETIIYEAIFNNVEDKITKQ